MSHRSQAVTYGGQMPMGSGLMVEINEKTLKVPYKPSPRKLTYRRWFMDYLRIA